MASIEAIEDTLMMLPHFRSIMPGTNPATSWNGSVGPATYNGRMDTFDVVLTARSNVDLESAEFDSQVAMIKPAMAWDPATSTWKMRLSSSHAEHVSNTLFEAARVYGTAVRVQLVPAFQAHEAPAPT
jgi:hypothetical protein